MSVETDAIVALVHTAVPNAPVTATLGRYVSKDNPCAPHSPGSYHCVDGTGGKGLAVDFGGEEPTRLAVFHALEPFAHQLAELFHNGPGITRVVKNGSWGDGLTTLGAVTWAAHTNHVHVAVHKGMFLTPAPPPVPPKGVVIVAQYDPPIPPIAAAWLDDQGRVISAATADGNVYWGKWWGNVAGKDYWGARKAARIGARPDGVPGYRITATDGANYDLPDGRDKL